MLVSACRRSLLVSACPLLSVSRSASIEAACQSQRVVRTAFRAVSWFAHLLRNVCLSVFASQCVSICLHATRVDLSYFASQRASVCLPANGVNDARRGRNRHFSLLKLTLGGSQIDLRSLQNRPQIAQGSSRKAQEIPRASQERPKSAQERPKSAPRAPKNAQRTLKSTPRAGQERPGESQDASQGAPGSPRGAF